VCSSDLEQIRELSDRFAALQSKMASTEPFSDDDFNRIAEKAGLTPEEMEYGPEFVRALVKISKSLTQDIREEFSQHKRETAEERFYRELGSMVPDALQINDSPEFPKWLGPSVKDYDDALARLDAPKVAWFFQKFKEAQGTPSPTPQPQGGQPGVKAAPKPSLKSQVAPASRGTGAPTPPPAYSEAEHRRAEAEFRRNPTAANNAKLEALEALREKHYMAGLSR